MDFAPSKNTAIVKYEPKKSGIHKVHALDKTLAGLTKNYFGIDLAELPNMTDQQLAEYADRAAAMDRLIEVLPILEKHFKTLIEGQVKYEQFVAEVQKDAAAAAKKIDQQILNVFLAGKGYQQHIRLMGEKAQNGIRLLDAEGRSALTLERMDFQTAMQIVARRHQSGARRIQEKIPLMERREALSEQVRKEREDRKDLLTNGSRSSAGKKGFWQGIGDWFSGR
ncbi:hypothetical protein [Coleofasciculus sp. FACHB-SPT9]|uniref:hypothetical protein n=1 Tax=Cyanophyceae TaxID=3028117 RepID=UPI001682E8FB|nr:hypothetical protein [Coleofasciculus sp. FACHB-SPT9]MBD1890499.1 hypothetical protein [Coleofasciculus sp. FACHB-SPT9]